MRSLNFIGGEKGGVGKSVLARLLAQYFIDKGRPFVGFDTDRSHQSFTRFYEGYASPVVVDSFEGLDRVAAVFEQSPNGSPMSAIVDLAAQTAAPLSRWIRDSDLLSLLAEMGVTVNFWHLCDAGRDSVDLLDRLLNTYGAGPNFIVVRNHGRGADFELLNQSNALKKAMALGAHVIDLDELHAASMRKIDQRNASFWAAVNIKDDPSAMGMLERQRTKTWLRNTYASFDALPL